jgi:O-antigen/teichoic acid export membrane protein
MPPPAADGALARGLSDTATLLLGSIVGAVAGLVTLRLLLSNLSEADYGRYSLFLVVGGVAVVFASWPTHAFLRLGAEEVEESGGIGRTFGSILAWVLLSLVLVGGATFLYRGELDAFVDAPSWQLAVAFAALSALSLLSYASLQPAGLVGLRTFFPALTKVCFAGLLVVVVASNAALELGQVLVLCTATAIVGAVMPLVAVGRRLIPIQVDGPTARRAYDYAWPLLVRNLGIAGVIYVDLLVIRHYLGPAEAGRYDVAYRIAEQVLILGIVLEFVAGPILATAAARKDAETLTRLYRLLAPQLSWLWGLGAALLIVVAEPALTLLGAKGVQESAAVLKVLALAVALRGPTFIESAVFEANLLSRWPTVFFFLALGVNLALDIGFMETTDWGLMGPALGTIACFLVHGLLRGGYIAKRFKVVALRPYLGVVPALLMLGIDVAAGGALLVTLLAWAGVACGVFFFGRRVGLFPAETRDYLGRVRMPALLRSALERFYS